MSSQTTPRKPNPSFEHWGDVQRYLPHLAGNPFVSLTPVWLDAADAGVRLEGYGLIYERTFPFTAEELVCWIRDLHTEDMVRMARFDLDGAEELLILAGHEGVV